MLKPKAWTRGAGSAVRFGRVGAPVFKNEHYYVFSIMFCINIG